MECYYCAQEQVEIAGRGTCCHCSLAICASPSGRYDGEFHGEPCLCGCGRLVCEKHLIEHARSHGQDDGSQCFPALWIAIGGGGIHGGAAVRMDPGGFNAEAWHEMTRFLNAVRPGREALLPLTHTLPGTVREFPEWGRPEEPKVVFSAHFFNRGVVDTVVAHAADAVGAAGERLLDDPEMPRVMAELAESRQVHPESLYGSVRALARWHRTGENPGGTALLPWMPRGAPHDLATQLGRVLDLRRPQRGEAGSLARELAMEFRAHGPAPVGDVRLDVGGEEEEAGIEIVERWAGPAAAGTDAAEERGAHGGGDRHHHRHEDARSLGAD